MKTALATWKWSLGVIARSPLVLLALAAVAAAWLYGAYRWLWFPAESAGYLLVAGALWALVQFLVLAGFVAGTAGSATDAAAEGGASLGLRKTVPTGRSPWLRGLVFVAVASLVIAAVHWLFTFVNTFSLEVASVLTFRSEKPVAPETVESVLVWIENLLWVVVLGFLLNLLLALLREGWREAVRAMPRLLAGACWRLPFLTGLVSVFVFGGFACLLVTWRPQAPPGFLDYAQVLLRNGIALLLAVAAWLFWALSLARQSAAAPALPQTSAGTPGSDPEPHASDF